MRKLSLVLVLALSTATAFARTTKTTKTNKINKTKFDVRVPVKNWIKKMNKGFRFGMATGSLNSNSKSRSSNAAEASDNFTASTNYELHAGWEEIKRNKAGYSAWATFQDLKIDGEHYRNMRLSGNATYGIDSQVYAYGGLNWGKYYGSDYIEGNVNAGMGYQAGIGFDLHKKANVEIEYLALINEGRSQGTNINIETKGIMLKVNTPFTFDI